MKPNKTFKITLSLMISAALGIGAGALIAGGRNRTRTELASENTSEKLSPIYNPAPYETSPPSETGETYYLLKNESDILTFYEISQGVRTVIKTIPINSSVLPQKDRESLLAGIEFSDKEYGYRLIEDYTS